MHRQLTAQQILDFGKVFSFLDKDNSGVVSTKELHNALSSLGVNATETRIQGIMNECDADGDGSLDIYEFLSLMTKWMGNSHVDETLSETFKKFDLNGDGLISAAELRYALGTMGEESSEKEIEEMIAEVDMDGDGCINYQEFSRMMGY